MASSEYFHAYPGGLRATAWGTPHEMKKSTAPQPGYVDPEIGRHYDEQDLAAAAADTGWTPERAAAGSINWDLVGNQAFDAGDFETARDALNHLNY